MYLRDAIKATLDEDLFAIYEANDGDPADDLTTLLMLQNARTQKRSAQALWDLSKIVDDGVLVRDSNPINPVFRQ